MNDDRHDKQVELAKAALRAVHETVERDREHTTVGTMITIAAGVLMGVEDSSGMPRSLLLRLVNTAMQALEADMKAADAADEGSDT